LNSIELICCTFDMLVDRKRASIHNLGNLKLALRQERKRLGTKYAGHLVRSVSRRSRITIDSKGDPTQY
ncbi:hypothetical protein J3Q64DRAFT_1638148, partial [Phycomyces blakesleeanus]